MENEIEIISNYFQFILNKLYISGIRDSSARGGSAFGGNPIFKVGVVGLEPTTSASRTLRASQLRYTPLLNYFSTEYSLFKVIFNKQL